MKSKVEYVEYFCGGLSFGLFICVAYVILVWAYLYLQMMPCVHPPGSRLWAVGLWCVLVMWEETLFIPFIPFNSLSLSSLRYSLFSLFTLLLRWLLRWFPWGYSRWFCAIDRGVDRWRQLLWLPVVLWDLGFWCVRDFVWGCVLES